MEATKIVLGTTSIHKLRAGETACGRIGIKKLILETRKTSSGQKEQPAGFAETYVGALTRAVSAKDQLPQYNAIGIESGIFPMAGTFLDIAIIVIMTSDGRHIVTTTPGFEFPSRYVNLALEAGFTRTTVGSIIAQELGGDATDPHATLSKGKITRTDLLIEGLVPALKQL